MTEGLADVAVAYDDLGRLTQADYDSGATVRTYTYDSAGRITSGGKLYNTSQPLHAPYQSDDGSGATTYTYDANGNMRSAGGGGVTHSYTWNAQNRLARAERSLPGKPTSVVDYAYDADGNRVKKEGTQTVLTFFPHYEERDGAAVKHYSFHGMPVAIDDGALRFVHTDHLGSTSLETDGSGAGLSGTWLRHFPYGEVRAGDVGMLTSDRDPSQAQDMPSPDRGRTGRDCSTTTPATEFILSVAKGSSAQHFPLAGYHRA